MLDFLLLKYFIFFYGDILNKINTVLIGGENKEKRKKRISMSKLIAKNINRLVSFTKKIVGIEKKEIKSIPKPSRMRRKRRRLCQEPQVEHSQKRKKQQQWRRRQRKLLMLNSKS